MQFTAGVFHPDLHPTYVEGQKLAARITELYAYITVAEYRFLTLVREFDEQGYWELSGITCCAHWLNWQCGIGMNAAREKVRVARAPAESPEISCLEEGPRVSAETSRRLACDSGILRLVKDRDGEPLSIGRRSRTIPPAIRRALKIRDGGCRFPGCANTRFVDGHHIRHWADGGETSLDNLVLLCRRHHRLVHEGGFACRREAGGQVEFRSPRGNVLPSCPTDRPAVAANDVVGWIAQHNDCGHIDSKTCVTRWTGERIDWPLAVGHLFPVDNDAKPTDTF